MFVRFLGISLRYCGIQMIQPFAWVIARQTRPDYNIIIYYILFRCGNSIVRLNKSLWKWLHAWINESIVLGKLSIVNVARYAPNLTFPTWLSALASKQNNASSHMPYQCKPEQMISSKTSLTHTKNKMSNMIRSKLQVRSKTCYFYYLENQNKSNSNRKNVFKTPVIFWKSLLLARPYK